MAAHLLCCCNITRRELLMNDKYITRPASGLVFFSPHLLHLFRLNCNRYILLVRENECMYFLEFNGWLYKTSINSIGIDIKSANP